jgi:hypothetical protein
MYFTLCVWNENIYRNILNIYTDIVKPYTLAIRCDLRTELLRRSETSCTYINDETHDYSFHSF